VKALDLFCGIGGASSGLAAAGFQVSGVDISYMPEYPYALHVGDALSLTPEYLAKFDLIWASPPCQAYSVATAPHRALGKKYPDLIKPTRALLEASGRPYIIENVLSAPIRRDLLLCGSMFQLPIIRHRKFEIKGFNFDLPFHKSHHTLRLNYPIIAGNGQGKGQCSIKKWQEFLGIPWATSRRGLANAIPPAYSKYIATEFLSRCFDG